MGTKHDAGRAGAETGARADGGGPRAARSRRTPITAALGVLATLVSAAATAMASASARVTYYLPPPDGSTDAVERHDWIESVLALIPVSLVSGLLALAVTVLSIVALARRREASPWLLLVAGLALVIGFAVCLAVPWLLAGIGTY